MPNRRPSADALEQFRREMRKQWMEAGYTDEDVQLMQRLATPHAPGQRLPGRRGRETKWTADDHLRLLQEVADLTGGHPRKVSWACRKLADREPWRSLASTRGSKRNVAEVLRERFVRLYMGAVDIYEHGEGGELDARIRTKQRERGGKYG